MCIAWWDYQDVPAYVKDAEHHEILITELSYLIKDTIKGYEYVHNFSLATLHADVSSDHLQTRQRHSYERIQL